LIISRKEDSVTSIHKRWHFTQINPSSYKFSLTIYELSAVVLVIISYLSFQLDPLSIGIGIALAAATVTAFIFLDFVLLRGIPVNKVSKVIHVSAFAYLFWLVTLIFGLVSNFLFEKNTELSTYIVEGMFMAIGLRYGIFVSVFGAGRLRSLIVALIGPLIFLFVSLWNSAFQVGSSLIVIVFGAIIVSISLIWSVYADGSGRPKIKSTFEVLQAFLLAWTEKKKENIETIFESRANLKDISTRVLRFRNEANDEVSLVLPEIHPGPFSPIGGSNLPFLLFKFFQRKAIIFHSVSDNSLNLPSSTEVEKYLNSLERFSLKSEGKCCTLPIQLVSGDFTVTGMAFSSTTLIIVSKNKGMEDLPFSFRLSIENKMSQFGIQELFVVDAHNGVGEKINQDEEHDLFNLASECLGQLKVANRYPFKISYFNSDSRYSGLVNAEDIGESGLGVVGFEIDHLKFVLGWSDSNNIVEGLKTKIINKAKESRINMLEVISSDSHSSSGKRTKKGYYSLGDKTDHTLISNIFMDLALHALRGLRTSYFQMLESKDHIKLMGAEQFNIYSSALNQAMKITKICIAVTAVIYLTMLAIS
jgi:putative membrane protein